MSNSPVVDPANEGKLSFRLPFIVVSLALTACSTCGALDSKMGQVKPGMTHEQVKTLLGQPISIEYSDTAGTQQDAYLYLTSNGEDRVVFFNSAVVKIEIVPGAKS